MTTRKFNNGPGVYRIETDISEVVSAPSTSIGAFVGKFANGPANRRVSITNNKEFLAIFGNPDSLNYGYAGYAALEFLNEGSQLWAVRATSGTEGYAHAAVLTSGGVNYGTIFEPSTSTLLSTAGYEDGNKADDIYALNNFAFSGQLFLVGASSPGSKGNDLAIQVVTSACATSAGFDWQYNYDNNPFTDSNTIWNRVFKINVLRKSSSSSNFASVSGSPVETFYVSRERILDANGNSLFIEDVINGNSNYIYVKNNSSVADTTRPTNSTVSVLALTGGVDNTIVDYTDIRSAWSLFSDPSKVSVQILVCTDPGNGLSNNASVQSYVGNIAASRKDAVALVQVDGTSETVTNPTTITANANYNYNNPSFVGLYAGWQLINDTYNGRKIYVPNVIYAGSLIARNDAIANVWDAPAGPNRGQIASLGMNVVWTPAQIGIFDNANINVAKLIPGAGIFMWGQKSAQRKTTALSDLNVRRLLNFVEGGLERFLTNFLFEANNSGTRGRIKSGGDAFLNPLAAAGAFNDNDGDNGFLFVCDSTNNGPEVINNNALKATVYIKPARVTYYIELETVVTKSGVEFSEIIRT